MGGSAYRKHAAGNSIERKTCIEDIKVKWSNVSAGEQSSAFTLQVSLSPSALRLFCFPAPVFLPLFYSPDCGVSSPLSSRDTVDVPRAKGNLFCTSSMHHVAASVDSTSRKCETGREGSLHKPNTVRPFSLLHLLQSGNTAGIRFSNGRVPRIWLLD